MIAAPNRVVEFLGRTGQTAVSKVMGLIILCVGIHFLINGLAMAAPEIFHTTAPAAVTRAGGLP